jgi:hypothetical protein
MRALDRLMRGLSFTLQEDEGQTVRAGLLSSDDMARQSVIESLSHSVAPIIAERLAAAYRETSEHEASLPTLTDMLIARTSSLDPYVRAVALYALGERGAANSRLLERMIADEHEVVRETALHLMERAVRGAAVEGQAHAGLITIEKMIALRSAPIFSTLAPEGLAELARACREDEYAPDEALCLEGEPGNEVFILLAGDVKVLKTHETGERVVAREEAGGFIGEMAVLDPAPRSATLRAGEGGVRVLRLDGNAFRNSLNNDSTIASSVIRTLAQRLRGEHK